MLACPMVIIGLGQLRDHAVIYFAVMGIREGEGAPSSGESERPSRATSGGDALREIPTRMRPTVGQCPDPEPK